MPAWQDGMVKIYFDGSARPNPGLMQTAVVARGITYHRLHPDSGDNNDAEWLALLHALEVALMIGANEITLLGDSALVVAQATRAAPCRAMRFRDRLAEFDAFAARFGRLRVRRIGRAQNLAGIALERIQAGCRG